VVCSSRSPLRYKKHLDVKGLTCLRIAGQFSLETVSLSFFTKKEKNERQSFREGEENGNTAVFCQI